jgi:PAS domain S-box-containing protein
VEDEACCDDGRTFVRRTAPYRTGPYRTGPYRTDDDRIGGVVITFFDITERKKAEDALVVAKELAEKVVDTVRESMLVLDTDLRVISANQSFYDTFRTSPAETDGRRVYELGNDQWDIPELRDLLKNVLPENNVFNDFEVTHEFETIGRKVMLLNGRKIDHIERILLAIEDVTHRRESERVIRESEERLRLATELTEIGTWEWFPETDDLLWSEVECRLVGCEPVTTQIKAQTFFDRVHPDDLAEMRRALDAAIEQDVPYDYEYRVVRADGEVRWLAGKGEVLRDDAGKTVRMMGVNFDITQQKDLEHELHRLNETLEQEVSRRTDMLNVLQDITRIANEAGTVEEAMLAAMERISRFDGWQVGHVWRLADDDSGEMVSTSIWHVSEIAAQAIDRLEEFQQICEGHRFRSGDGVVGTVMMSGEPHWINDVKRYDDWRRGSAEHFGLHALIAFPVTVNGEVVAVMEFFSDHTAKRDKRFMEIMPDVGIQLGHVIERKRLERMAANMTEAEQRRIGSDIHDGVGQELTGLRYMMQTHAEVLAAQSSPEAKTAQRMTEWLEKVQRLLRGIVRKLVPVEIDEQGLVASLRGLAEQTTQAHDVVCSLECAQAILVADATLATHIYRIAQEAVRNAVRHAEASQIRITLSEDAGVLKLQVEDDGIGIKPTTNQKTGFGLRSMAYRAGLIGAQFDCRPREQSGTSVTCKVLQAGGGRRQMTKDE